MAAAAGGEREASATWRGTKSIKEGRELGFGARGLYTVCALETSGCCCWCGVAAWFYDMWGRRFAG